MSGHGKYFVKFRGGNGITTSEYNSIQDYLDNMTINFLWITKDEVYDGKIFDKDKEDLVGRNVAKWFEYYPHSKFNFWYDSTKASTKIVKSTQNFFDEIVAEGKVNMRDIQSISLPQYNLNLKILFGDTVPLYTKVDMLKFLLYLVSGTENFKNYIFTDINVTPPTQQELIPQVSKFLSQYGIVHMRHTPEGVPSGGPRGFENKFMFADCGNKIYPEIISQYLLKTIYEFIVDPKKYGSEFVEGVRGDIAKTKVLSQTVYDAIIPMFAIYLGRIGKIHIANLDLERPISYQSEIIIWKDLEVTLDVTRVNACRLIQDTTISYFRDKRNFMYDTKLKLKECAKKMKKINKSIAKAKNARCLLENPKLIFDNINFLKNNASNYESLVLDGNCHYTEYDQYTIKMRDTIGFGRVKYEILMKQCKILTKILSKTTDIEGRPLSGNLDEKKMAKVPKILHVLISDCIEAEYEKEKKSVLDDLEAHENDLSNSKYYNSLIESREKELSNGWVYPLPCVTLEAPRSHFY